MKYYQVRVSGNFLNSGKYQYSFKAFEALAYSKEDCTIMFNNNIELITEYFKNKRDRNNKRILRLSENSKIRIGRINTIVIGGWPTVLFEDKFQKINLLELKKERPELFI